MAVGLALLPFLLLELVLRAAGAGHDTRLIVRNPAANSATGFQFNTAADLAYYGVEDIWGPDPRPFEIPKPAGTYRIVVVGGSTVAGFPFPFELALPRLLEAVLSQQMPARKFEVLNAGMTSIMSLSEVDIVRQAVACQPDLIVVHSGHNEFYGPGGSASNSGDFIPGFSAATQFLKRQRSFQLLSSLVRRPTKKHLVERLPADIGIPLDGPVFRRTRELYQSNLICMVGLAQRAGVPILLSTVPSNLRDFAPLQPPENEATLRHLKEAERFVSYREYESALSTLIAARREDALDPLLAYRQAQVLQALGRDQEAAEMYTLALDLDGCRFRAATSFLDAVGEIATGTSQGVYFCDVAAVLRSRSQFSVPGSDFFLEHVHYNLEGNWQAATALAHCIVEDVLGASWQPRRHVEGPARDKLLDVTLLDRLAADSLTVIGYDAWPFSLSPARKQEAAVMKSRLAAGYQQLEPTERELFAGLSMEAMNQHLWLAMGHAWLDAGDASRALAAFQRHVHRRPWDPAGYVGAASSLRALARDDEAAEMLALARRYNHDKGDAK